jgi:hypothetical protein
MPVLILGDIIEEEKMHCILLSYKNLSAILKNNVLESASILWQEHHGLSRNNVRGCEACLDAQGEPESWTTAKSELKIPVWCGLCMHSFIMHSSNSYKAWYQLDIELVIG